MLQMQNVQSKIEKKKIYPFKFTILHITSEFSIQYCKLKGWREFII